jgi:hypothetical protein
MLVHLDCHSPPAFAQLCGLVSEGQALVNSAFIWNFFRPVHKSLSAQLLQIFASAGVPQNLDLDERTSAWKQSKGYSPGLIIHKNERRECRHLSIVQRGLGVRKIPSTMMWKNFPTQQIVGFTGSGLVFPPHWLGIERQN